MTSYATIERFEDGKIAVLEAEMIPVEESNSEDYYDKKTHPCEMLMVSIEFIESCVGEVEECDVLVIKHDGICVYSILRKADDEKARRQAVYDEIMEN